MPMLQSKLKKLWALEYFWVLLHVLITIFYDLCSDYIHVTLFMSLDVWYVHIESMTKELESKMCNIFIILSCCENCPISNIKNTYSAQIPLINMIILRCNMPMLRSKLKKLWAFEYFWVLLHVLITIFYDLCSVTFMSSVHVSSCVICPYRKYD